MTFSTQWSRLKAILSVIPKTVSVFRLLMVRAPAGLHLVESPPTGDSGGRFSPPVPIYPCAHLFLSGYVYRTNDLFIFTKLHLLISWFFSWAKWPKPSLWSFVTTDDLFCCFTLAAFGHEHLQWFWCRTIIGAGEKAPFSTGYYTFLVHGRTWWLFESAVILLV